MLGILCYCLSSFQRHFQGERPVSFKFVVCVLACAHVLMLHVLDSCTFFYGQWCQICI